ncbi:response regulator transcription factor [Lactonifactor longoviformis]|uniref:Stage 0 sporulation protein A homolog n=1 Tax=Lactonifactor longoviformis DSM 17459 TaxID=1122155 RepID=A0A1M5BB94_9CLOT|nr:AraC family transcriptional regulator [Lactonifactor longoviformis]SHF39656.1 Helix-turn-helix domain-containing protein [Lactonifactor longoviformis DSM 17459]
MLKVLIADDETLVCELIKMSIDWGAIGLEVCGTAYNGLEALEMALKVKPDIIITDVRMAGLDGLSLIEGVRNARLDCRFIIISGYPDFSYAQKALKLSVFEYILKPIDEVTLTEALIRLRNKIQLDSEASSQISAYKNQLDHNLELMRSRFLTEQLSLSRPFAMPLEEINETYQFQFQYAVYAAIVVKVDSIFEESQPSDMDTLLLRKMCGAIRQRMNKGGVLSYSIVKPGRVISIVNCTMEQAADLYNLSQAVLSELQNRDEWFNQYSFTVGLGTMTDSLDKIHHSLTAADTAVKYRIVNGGNRVINSASLSFPHYSIRDYITVDDEKTFFHLLQNCDTIELKNWILSLFQSPHIIKYPSPPLLFDLAEKCADIFGEAVKTLDPDSMPRSELLRQALDNCRSLEDILRTLLDHIQSFAQDFYTSRTETYSKPIQMMKDYVLLHYREPIKLNDMAELVHFHPNYLSELFRKETGMTFSDYLTDCRLDAAKRLLLDLQYNVYDVAELVGIKDTKYFSRIFKKAVGVTPSEYRKLHM